MKYLFISMLVLTCSCSKHLGDVPEHIPDATLQIFAPTEGKSFNIADSVQIKATAISTETIHGYDVYITRQNDTAKIYSVHVHDHNDTLLIDQKWKYTAGYTGNAEAHVLLTLDHDGHTLHKKVNISLQ